ncbi:MAG: hypothetical protein ACFFB7_04730, partial [Candidatus Sifarchaeia archaeon]
MFVRDKVDPALIIAMD